MPPVANFLAEARRLLGGNAPPPAVFSITYEGVGVKVVPVRSVFAYAQANGGYRLVKQQGGAHADLYDVIVGAEPALCDVGTGVSVSQSLKPSNSGSGLLYQAGCKLVVAEQGGTLKGVALVCTYEIGEGLIEPRAFGTAADDSVRAQLGVPALMLELICARGPATADGRNANHVAAKALVEAMRRFAVDQNYGFVVAKAENARSRDFLQRRGFDMLFQRGPQAAMKAAVVSIRV